MSHKFLVVMVVEDDIGTKESITESINNSLNSLKPEIKTIREIKKWRLRR